MTNEQVIAIKCAFADLCGALQAFQQNDIHTHDWEAHLESIEDLVKQFPNIDLELPDDI
jgi:hypothetical protein